MAATSNRSTAVYVPMVLTGMLIFYGVVYTFVFKQPWLLLVAGAGIALLAAQLWWLLYANRWQHYEPAAGLTFEPRSSEVPVLADHRDAFGPGEARNVIYGPDFTAFELMQGGRPRWCYVVEMEEPHGKWHVKPPTSNNGLEKIKDDPFEDRYEAYGPVPDVVKRTIAASPFAELDVRVDGRLLIGTDIAMSANRFPEWHAREGKLMQLVARVLAQQEPIMGEAAKALSAPDPARNVWQAPDGEATAQPHHERVRTECSWQQPPRR